MIPRKGALQAEDPFLAYLWFNRKRGKLLSYRGAFSGNRSGKGNPGVDGVSGRLGKFRSSGLGCGLTFGVSRLHGSPDLAHMPLLQCGCPLEWDTRPQSWKQVRSTEEPSSDINSSQTKSSHPLNSALSIRFPTIHRMTRRGQF